jgi:HPt (histidine-containing phosphotransfer) domain-containing protein
VEIIDTDILSELSVLDAEDLRDLIELYFADVATQLGLLREALASGDIDTVAGCAHRIKGASLSVGAARVAALATELEDNAKAGDTASAPELAASLESELDPTRAALSSELSVDLPG